MPTTEAFLGVLPFNIKGTSSPIPRRRNQNQGSSINDRLSRLFKHRGSRVMNTETSQQSARVDRACTSEFETQYLQQRSTELLLQNEFAVAKLMCHLEVSGDRAATMASHLVSFLRGNPTTAGCVDIFVMGAFDIHLRKYASVSPNPRNILRDNNLATMLVVCYLQQSCRSYLVSILQPVMTAIAPFVHNCELDPNRLANDHDTATTSRNAYNLYCVCRSVLDAVFSAGKHAPVEMRRLCALIRTRIEAAWEPLSAYSPTPNAPSRQDTPVSKQKEPEQPILELKDWETDLKTTVQVDIMSDIKAALEGWLEHPDKERAIASATLPSSAMSSTLKHVSNSQRREPHVRLTKHASNIGVTENNKYADNKVHSPGDANSYSEARQSLVKMMSSSFSSSDRLDTSLSTSKQKRLQIPEPLRASEIKNTWRQTQSPRKTMGPGMSARFSKHASRRYSGSYFTPVETVISMLIFVRFFIPILTAPDAYGLDVKMSPANRRGLLLCAKVLAVLCNGVSFGSKETYLMPMNGLIKEYRPKLRHYLHAISSNVTPSAAAGGDEEGSDNEYDQFSDSESSDDDNSFTIDELVSQFQVVSVGAKIASKEEQRKSRMSFAHPYTASSVPPISDPRHKDVPPVPLLPQLPPVPSKKSPLSRLTRQASAEATATVKFTSAQPSRTTIDIPSHLAPASSALSSSAAVAISSSASDSLLDNEIVDESLVTIDFLICLESNFDKLEEYIRNNPHSNQNQQQQLLDACRELKPIVHYAKRLSSPARLPETVSLSQGGSTASYESRRRLAAPFGHRRTPSQRISDDFEDLGHRHTNTMPEGY